MKFRVGLLFATLLSGVTVFGGCVSQKSFVDPTYPKVTYDELKKRPTPLKLALSVEFQRNGEHAPRVDSTLKDNTERILRASGIVDPVAEGGVGSIKVVMNNIADLGTARAKGFGTGLTLGLAGSLVTDAYEMSVTITRNGKTVSRTGIKHALHTAIGNTATPEGIETMPPSAAFERGLEQMLLRVVKEMQESGQIGLIRELPLSNGICLASADF
jgi:hypothetical protein